MRLIASIVRRFLIWPVHLRQRILALDNAEQSEQVGQRVFQGTVEDGDPAGDLLAAGAFVIPARNSEVVA